MVFLRLIVLYRRVHAIVYELRLTHQGHFVGLSIWVIKVLGLRLLCVIV